VIFRSISEAIREYPELVKKWLGRVVPMADNFFAALNCAVFSDGTFVYVPEGCAARWSCPPISASTRKTPASSNAR
jgi:Fe-S cluster assembly protein SufB